MVLDFFPLLFRYVAQGKGILQPHVLIDELDNIFGDDEGRQNLRDGPFSEVIKSAQVNFYFSSICFRLMMIFFIDTDLEFL